MEPNGKTWSGDGFHLNTLFSKIDDNSNIYSPFLFLSYGDSNSLDENSQNIHSRANNPTFSLQKETYLVKRGKLKNISSGEIERLSSSSDVVHEEFHSACSQKILALLKLCSFG